MMEAISQAQTWLKEGKNIQLLALYAQRIQRSIERNMAELRTLRAERKAAREQALEEAVLFSQLAKSKGETYDAAADFPSPIVRFFNRRIRATAHPQTASRRSPRPSQNPAKPESRPPNARRRMKKNR